MVDASKHFDLLQNAISLAARAHRAQLRKDKETPYAAHPFRVCMTVRHLFGVDDAQVLAAAVLHDTIEDTTTDRDDLIESFGQEIAGWVAALSKDKRLPEPERERAYEQQIETAPWQVKVIKLADLFDNLSDAPTMPTEKREKSFRRAKEMLPHVMRGLPARYSSAVERVKALLVKR